MALVTQLRNQRQFGECPAPILSWGIFSTSRLRGEGQRSIVALIRSMLAPRWGLQAIFHAPCLEITGFGKTSRIARSTSSDAQMMSASLGIVSYLSPAWRVSFTNKKKPSKLLWQLYMPGRPEHFLTSKGISKHEGSWSIWNIWRKLASNMEKPSSYVYI